MHSEERPLVSIIIPVYNGSNYLQEAIDSALAQTYPKVEVLVINDGSYDEGKTEMIALSYRDRIRYISKENGGVASALNTGIKNMRGEYFSWLSHDDVYYPDKVEKELDAVFKSGDPTKIVQCEYDFHDEDSGLNTPTDFYKYYSVEQLTNSVFSVLQLQIHACGALIHKSHFNRVGLFEEKRKYTQDIEMWLRLLFKQRSLWVSEKLFQVRVHSNSDSKHYFSMWNQENAQLYYDVVQALSNRELAEIYGTAETALCRMIGLLRSREGYQQAAILEKRLQECYKNCDHGKDICRFRQYLRKQCHGEDKDIVIFGAGQYGKRLLYELGNRQITVSGFMDNDEEKKGKQVEGVLCNKVEYYVENKENVLVIIAQRTYAEAIQQMQRLGFPYVVTRQELDGILIRYAPQL